MMERGRGGGDVPIEVKKRFISGLVFLEELLAATLPLQTAVYDT